MDTTRALFFAINMPSSGQDEPTGEVCIPNISPREREKRMRFAVAQFTVTIFILAVLTVYNVDPAWRLFLLFMFWPAAIGYFEARDKTCVAHALNKTRKLGERSEKIEDEAELKQVHRQSRKVILKAFYVALALTLIVYLLPL
jgi:hypothetical protein